MPILCITCGTSMPDVAQFCPACGRAVQVIAGRAVRSASEGPIEELLKERAPQASVASDTGSQPNGTTPPVASNDRLVAAAAYLTFIPAIVFLVVKSFGQRKFVRFHSWQSLFFWILVGILLGVGVLASTFGFLLIWLFTGTLVILALILTWFVLSIKALQGEWFRLPGLGDYARQLMSAR